MTKPIANGSNELHAAYAPLDIDQIIDNLSIDDKIALLSGSDFWHSADLPQHGIPPMRMCDGPNGIRGIRFFAGDPSNCYPCATALAATFNRKLLYEVGGKLAEEAKAKGCHIWLGPTLNIQRSPLGGRGFESFSEDPLLSGLLSASIIQGCQARGVAATPKHYLCNETEFKRHSSSSDVSMRAVREIYLKPFDLLIREAKPWCLMSSYNRINGEHVSESRYWLQTVLRKELGFDGLVISDWYGTYSTTEALQAGMDLEMPGATIFRGAAVRRALVSGKISMSDIDECAARVLEMVNRAIDSGIPFSAPQDVMDTAQSRKALLQTAQESILMMRNKQEMLPLSKAKTSSIAIIGHAAKATFISGGGSASLRPTYYVNPHDAIASKASSLGIVTKYALGVTSYRYLPLLDPFVTSPEGVKGEYLLEFFAEEPLSSDIKSVHVKHVTSSDVFMVDNIPFDVVPRQCWARMTTYFEPEESGPYTWGLVVGGQGDLYIDNELLIENSKNQTKGDLFFGGGSSERKSRTFLEAGRRYALRMEWSNFKKVDPKVGFHTFGAYRIGVLLERSKEERIAEAIQVAKVCDTVVFVTGLGSSIESEGFDRDNMSLPEGTDELIEAVCKANPNTCVLVQSGTQCEMTWAESPRAILQCWYGGNEAGNAMASVLFGESNPSAKAPLTFTRTLQDQPSHPFGPGKEGHTYYRDDVFVGYRKLLDNPKNPAVVQWFGQGMSFSTFELNNPDIQEVQVDAQKKTVDFTCSVSVTNSSVSDGAEVVQCYISPPEGCPLPRPQRELAAFAKVWLRSGETKLVDLTMDRGAFSYWDDSIVLGDTRGSWVIEDGEYLAQIGTSSVDIAFSISVSVESRIEWRP